MLLLDVSGSVEERIDFIRKAARDFLNTASPQDRIAIISFRDDIQIISDFSTDRKLLSQKLDEIDAGGATALYDALGFVLADTVKQLRGERTAMVILSDGDDNKSFVPFPAILEAIIESGALIYPLVRSFRFDSRSQRAETGSHHRSAAHSLPDAHHARAGRRAKTGRRSPAVFITRFATWENCNARTTTSWSNCAPLTRSPTLQTHGLRQIRECACAPTAKARRCV